MVSKGALVFLIHCIVAIGELEILKLASAQDATNSKEFTYGVIVDCGSSGTRAHIFEWDSALEYPELLNHVGPMRDKDGKPVAKKITPGLSSVKDEPEKASDYIKPIVDFINEHIPAESIKSTSVYFMGTAGMRLLDRQTQASIMEDIANDLKTKQEFAKVSTSVISGAFEGMYQWITVNSKAKRFSQLPTSDSRTSQTYAIIEMGGASIQVTYQLKADMMDRILRRLAREPEAQRVYSGQLVEPQISRETEGHSYKLFSATFLGLGSNSARDAYVDMLVMRHEHQATIRARRALTRVFKSAPVAAPKRPIVLKDPCLPKGARDLEQRPVRMLNNPIGQTIGFATEDEEKTFGVLLMGTGNYRQCRRNLGKLLTLAKKEKLNCSPDETCPMTLLGTKFVPFPSFQFLGLSEFYYTTKEMLNLAGPYDQQKIALKTRKICSTPIEKLHEMYPEADENDDTRVQMECFKAVWMDTFLLRGLGMPSEFDSLTTAAKINGDELEWTLGAVLDKSLAIERAAEAAESADATKIESKATKTSA